MVSCFLEGGLGNQMFQIAATWALSKELNVGCCFNLNQTNIITQGHKASKYSNSLFKNLNIDCSSSITNYYKEPKFSYSEIPKVDHCMLIGVFQSEKYFVKYKKNLDEIFFIDQERINKIKNKLSTFSNGEKITSIHVRRGDYLNKPNYHPVCSVSYYKKAIEISETNKFVIVSDDIKWCKENFVSDNFLFSESSDELEDFYTIMSCDNHIIANSSFSWWGSYLSKSQNKKIISPSVWFGPNGHQDTQDIYLESWIKI